MTYLSQQVVAGKADSPKKSNLECCIDNFWQDKMLQMRGKLTGRVEHVIKELRHQRSFMEMLTNQKI